MAKKLGSGENNALALSSSGSQRVSLTLGGSIMEELMEIAEDEDLSIAEATRRSIKRDLALRKFEKQGGKVMVEFPDGKIGYILPT
jgi:hypothetical protein